AAIEQKEGRKERYHVETLMIQAKGLARALQAEKPDLAAIAPALTDVEATVKALETLPADDAKLGSFFLGSAKTFLTSAKQLMRHTHGTTPPQQGDQYIVH